MPLHKTRRVTRDNPCKICGRTTWCLEAIDGTYAVCMDTENDRPAQGPFGGWIHRLKGGGSGSGGGTAYSFPRRDEPQLAPLDHRDRILRRLLAASPLGCRHGKELLERGYSRDEIRGRGYGTLRDYGRARLAAACQGADPESVLVGIPGLWRQRGPTVAGPAGLLIPVLAPNGQVRGCRIRVDDPAKGQGKYAWHSSANKPGGTSSGVHCHVARPLFQPAQEGVVWITEGELKSDLSAERLGAVVLSVPGAGLWSRALPDLVELLPGGGRAIVAMDSDWRSKPQVHVAIWDLCQACLALGYVTEVALWDTTNKGLDDLLVAGLRPTLHPPAAVRPPEWKLRVSSRVLAKALPRVTAAPLTLEAAREQLADTLAECLYVCA